MSILVQLLVESLPLSSSGHLFIVNKFLCENFMFSQGGFFDLSVFFDLLHGVTAFIIVLFFFSRWSLLLRGALREVKTGNIKKIFFSRIFLLMLFTGIADIITTLFYVAFKIYGMPAFPVYIGFGITGTTLLLVSLMYKKNKKRQLTRDNFLLPAVILGVVQSIALLPGISRLATTYAASRLLGFSHRHSFEISFMIQWPLITAASTVAAYKLYSAGLLAQLLHLPLLLVILIGGIGAWYMLILTEYCARKNKLWLFGLYLFVLASLLFFNF